MRLLARPLKDAFCCHMNREWFGTRYISVTESPERTCLLGHLDRSATVVLIDHEKIKGMGIQANRTADMTDKFGVQRRGPDKINTSPRLIGSYRDLGSRRMHHEDSVF